MSEPPIIPDTDPGPEISGWNDSPVAGDRVDLHMGPIIAGNPEGARVEVTETGLRAFDATGTETARIQGEGGEFVGGEFRTSDALPGQVTMADDAYTSSITRAVHPGIRVDPIDPSGIDIAPGIGPSTNGIRVDGGRSTDGSSAHIEASPGYNDMYSRDGQGYATWVGASARSGIVRTDDPDGNYGLVQTNAEFSSVRTMGADGSQSAVEALRSIAGLLVSAPDGSKGEVNVTPSRSRIRVRDTAGTTVSEAFADTNQAYLYTRAGGRSRYLVVNAEGVWVHTETGLGTGEYNSYNLEETAQDSGWQPFTPAPGFTLSASAAWRNKGGVIYFRGNVTGTWTTGYNTIVSGIDATIRPAYAYTVNEAGTGEAGVMIRMESNGDLKVSVPTAKTQTYRLTALSYPTG